MSLAAAPVALDYAAAGTNASPALRSAARWTVAVSALSGACVAVCFVPLAALNGVTSDVGALAAATLHAGVFAATVAVACVTEARWRAAGGRVGTRFALDALALVGLAVLGVAPMALFPAERAWPKWVHYEIAPLLLAVPFALLGGTTWRHVAFHRVLAERARDLARPTLARGLVALGWAKFIYEGLWLTACAAVLLVAGLRELSVVLPVSSDALVAVAFGTLFGCFGYGAVWVWMLVAHGLLARAARTG